MIPFTLADQTFSSRLWLGSGKFASAQQLTEVVAASGTELVTLAITRLDLASGRDQLLAPLRACGVRLLPNTAGARDADEALLLARLTREALGTPWLKLEIHPDPRYLMPDPVETLKAAEQLVAEGFVVLPYVHADPVLCKRLEEVGCAAVMPLAAPIGSNRGLLSRDFLAMIIDQSRVPVIVDAGLGAPSHAAAALELGASAVLVNSALAAAADPVAMAHAFRLAVAAGALGHSAGLATSQTQAVASSPLAAWLEALA